MIIWPPRVAGQLGIIANLLSVFFDPIDSLLCQTSDKKEMPTTSTPKVQTTTRLLTSRRESARLQEDGKRRMRPTTTTTKRAKKKATQVSLIYLCVSMDMEKKERLGQDTKKEILGHQYNIERVCTRRRALVRRPVSTPTRAGYSRPVNSSLQSQAGPTGSVRIFLLFPSIGKKIFLTFSSFFPNIFRLCDYSSGFRFL